MTHVSRLRVVLAAALLLAGMTAHGRTWDFAVYLDGERVGRHRFELREDGAGRVLTSTARFEVTLLGFRAYRYEHEATERWNGDCLAGLVSRTDDNGQRYAVDVKPEGCEMSFAYWNPRILARDRLLNAQTGALERVEVATLGGGRYRITGAKHPIELTYAPEGQWTALDATLENGRRLSYRLQGSAGKPPPRWH